MLIQCQVQLPQYPSGGPASASHSHWSRPPSASHSHRSRPESASHSHWSRPPSAGHSHGPPSASHSHQSGSAGASHPHHSGESVGSGSSGGSADSSLSTESVRSLRTLTNQVSADLYSQNTLATRLRNWLREVDPLSYAQNRPWSEEILKAYNRYKRYGDALGAAHQHYHTYLDQTRPNPTAEQRLGRARLAVAWGQAAVKYAITMLFRNLLIILTFSSAARSRLRFIETYQRAYSSTDSISTHIDTAVEMIQSGMNAVEEARLNYESMHTTSSKIR
jgi:hypothetical protein